MKGQCPECKQMISLKKDGTLRGHGFKQGPYPTNWCPGSWEKPRRDIGTFIIWRAKQLGITIPKKDPVRRAFIQDSLVMGMPKSERPAEYQCKHGLVFRSQEVAEHGAWSHNESFPQTKFQRYAKAMP